MIDVFKKEHVGMTVYDNTGDVGVIKEYRDHERMYPVIVEFESREPNTYPAILSFTSGGFLYKEDRLPALYFKPFKLPEGWDVPPNPFIPKDNLLWVRDRNVARWMPRYFSHWEKDLAVCYPDGRTSKTNEGQALVAWRIWKRYPEAADC